MSLPRSKPSAESVDALGIHAFLDVIEAAPDVEPHSLMILRHGRVVAEGWWAPFSSERPHAMYSLSKSFTSTALGFAVQEKLLDLDDRVLDHLGFLQNRPAPDSSGYWGSMRIRHIASMSSGHASEKWGEAVSADPAEPVRGFLTLPPDREPGTVFAYNQPTTYTLAAILQQLTGTTLIDYLRPRLFDPLGVEFASWQQLPNGRDLGFTGLHVTTETVASLGELYLRRGVWQGHRLLPEAWVVEATSCQVSNAGAPNPDWQQGYGFQFWMSRHGYRGDGAFGQLCVVLPEQDAVIAYTGSTIDFQSLLDKVWVHLLPAFNGSVDSGGDQALAERLGELSLSPLSFAHPRPQGLPASLTPTGSTGTALPMVTGVEVLEDSDGLSVVLRDERAALPLRIGVGEWVLSEPPGEGRVVPVAASGGWESESTLRFDVLFLETPHRLEVSCDVGNGHFQADWVNAPAGTTHLDGLHAPSRAT